MKKWLILIIALAILVIGFLGFYSINQIKNTQTFGDEETNFWDGDGVSLAIVKETGEYECFGCNIGDDNYPAVCIDPLIDAIEFVDETEDLYCDNNFEVVEKSIRNGHEDFKEENNKLNWKFRKEWGNCEEKEIKFDISPLNVNVISDIDPLGKSHSSHVTPTDHQYWRDDKGWDSVRTSYEVYSPGDGIVVEARLMPNQDNDYRLVLWHSCSVSTIFIHLADVPDKFLNGRNPVEVKAGEVLGKTRGSFDFSVHDNKVSLKGFVNPELYKGEPWKIHTVDPFDYFEIELKNKLIAKTPRTVEPIGGKIDYDIDGKLIGNWFLEGSIDYSGNFVGNYWENHLAIVPDFIYPEITLINMGGEEYSGISKEKCNVCQGAFGIKSGSKNPKDVGVEDGLVKYELVARIHVDDSKSGARVSVLDESKKLGIFLVQMLEDRKIKAEIFPDKKLNEVTGFTSSARIYGR
jgi:hypothetical protein